VSDLPLARLLVLGSRLAPGPGTEGEVRRLAAAVGDWDALLVRAEDEGVGPLLYWNLRDATGAAPAAVLEALRRAFLRNLARNTVLYRELETFLAPVRRDGLRAALTKGGRLALDVYPDPALRPFWDVDFVVHPADWPAVRRILRGLGFEEAEGASAARTDGAGRALDWTYSPYFRKGPLFLEFHSSPLGLHFPGRDEDGVWSSAGRLAVRGTEALVLPAENELCYLCVHALQHSYERLVWLADIAGLAGRPGLDWDGVVRIAREARVRGPVHHGLSLAGTLWPGSVPGRVLAELRPGPAGAAALRLLWPPGATAARRRVPAWPYYMPSVLSLCERRDPGLAARTLRAIFFPPRAWLAAATGTPEGSLRLYGRYLERLARPALVAARRLVDPR
jgi:hypothetical protein